MGFLVSIEEGGGREVVLMLLFVENVYIYRKGEKGEERGMGDGQKPWWTSLPPTGSR